MILLYDAKSAEGFKMPHKLLYVELSGSWLPVSSFAGAEQNCRGWRGDRHHQDAPTPTSGFATHCCVSAMHTVKEGLGIKAFFLTLKYLIEGDRKTSCSNFSVSDQSQQMT